MTGFALLSVADLFLLVPAGLLICLAVGLVVRAEVRRALLARRYARREGMVDLTGMRRG